MGKIICKMHGGNDIVETCPHIATKMRAGTPFVAHRIEAMLVLHVCPECFKDHGFEEYADLPAFELHEDKRLSDRRWEATDVITEGKEIFCSKCVAELAHSL